MNRKYLDLTFVEQKLDAIVTSSRQTRLWCSSVESSDGWTILEKDKNHIFVDSRYIEYAQKQAKNAEVHLLEKNSLKNFLAAKNYQTIGIEADYETYGMVQYIKSMLPEAEIKPVSGQKLRILKTAAEIEKLQKAIDISLEAYEELLPSIQEGQTERELDHKLNFLMKQKGADKECFDAIIATGTNSSKPHHHPTDAKIKKGELLKIDFGAIYKGFGADITRTFIFGGTPNNAQAQEIWDIVDQAARLGRQMVRPGIKASQVHQVCYDYIQSKGYGDKFLHSTGHGLGIDVHELPNVNSVNETILEPGMVITVEPGIYIEGLGGVRIEDDILVTETGSITLSRKNEINGVEK
ncbi:aminopeptidase P family protein [Mycoplasma iguanae]|uniref:Aminopeptidase P family protein n=1 Tax=Mycoplasma iguanae TaxID=292461 RepID=A0ABY5R8L6_9MOLU|nr:aminopeptidase P family protein [Mycoplasma iguanae]UVD81512.1 aminopeptidase P family protein [Mycoplasma iguanae]